MKREIKRQELKREILRLCSISIERNLDKRISEERDAGRDPMYLLEAILEHEEKRSKSESANS
jgi:hypothetical protein